jgi:GNAT superfamily N-acetyltransferase
MAADTLPAFRSRGIHTALVHARLAAAREAGCDLAMVHTRPGAVSQRNILRAGFQLAYTLGTLLSPG